MTPPDSRRPARAASTSRSARRAIRCRSAALNRAASISAGTSRPSSASNASAIASRLGNSVTTAVLAFGSPMDANLILPARSYEALSVAARRRSPCHQASPPCEPSMTCERTSPLGARPARRWRSFRPWARSMPGISLWSRSRKACRPRCRLHLRQPAAVRPARRLRTLIPATRCAMSPSLPDAGLDLLYAPDPGEMYPPGFTTKVIVGESHRRSLRRGRPNHFDGVATVVTKLLLQCAPDFAVFGEKDYQQLLVIKRLVRRPEYSGRDRGRRHRARGGRPRAVFAQRLSLAGGTLEPRRCSTGRFAQSPPISATARGADARRESRRASSSRPKAFASTMSRSAIPTR